MAYFGLNFYSQFELINNQKSNGKFEIFKLFKIFQAP